MLARVQPLFEADFAVTERFESLVRSEYELCHPEDTFDDLTRRAQFSKEDKGLLKEWIRVAAGRDR